MNTIFVNSENSKISDPHRLLLNLPDKMNLKRSDNHIALSNFSISTRWKISKSHTKIINLKYLHLQRWINLNHLMDHILYHLFKIILSILSTKNWNKD